MCLIVCMCVCMCVRVCTIMCICMFMCVYDYLVGAFMCKHVHMRDGALMKVCMFARETVCTFLVCEYGLWAFGRLLAFVYVCVF
jgi:hypothetical protein